MDFCVCVHVAAHLLDREVRFHIKSPRYNFKRRK